MPNRSRQFSPIRPISAPRKVVIYLGTAISTVGAIIFLSGFLSFGQGFIEFVKPLPEPYGFDEKEQIFYQMVVTTLPRWFGGLVLMSIGQGIAAVGKKGITQFTEEGSKKPNVGFFVENYINEGDKMLEDRSVSIQATSGSNVVYAGNNLSGTVTTAINQLHQTHNPDIVQLMEVLRQLQQVIENESNLTDEDKEDALEQVKVLAEAGQSPREKSMQKIARNAVKILRGTAAVVPSATEMLKACNELLPIIAQLLGLAM